jgi:NADPH-dependent 2,4-dienoyl-CoA reductase/sulfur reductase-like enzyme
MCKVIRKKGMMTTSNITYDDLFDLVIVGGGPAGLSAAAEASSHGLTVALVDERATLGGQIYKQFGLGFKVKDDSKLGHDYLNGRKLIESVQNQSVTVFLRTTAVAIDGERIIIAPEDSKVKTLMGRRILLAPGAHDRPVTFPGWTLPGVITAGGAQTLVKTQRVIPGERILFVGSGPLALAFPAQLKNYGANVLLTLEAGRAPGLVDLLRLMFATFGNFRLMVDAAKYRWTLLRRRVPIRYRRIIVNVGGQNHVEYAIHAKVDKNWRVIPGTDERVDVDTVCIGYGFFPSVELFRLAGCELSYDENLGGPTVNSDLWGRTTIENVFAAGDGMGVEGSYVAIAKGRIAALKIAEDLHFISEHQVIVLADSSFRQLNFKRRFQKALLPMFRVGAGIYELSDNQTTICRCENIKRAEIDVAVAATSDISVVKAYTRAGMGLCQGRNCQRQISALIAQAHEMEIADVPFGTPRFPAKPLSLGAIADDQVQGEKYFLDA